MLACQQLPAQTIAKQNNAKLFYVGFFLQLYSTIVKIYRVNYTEHIAVFFCFYIN